MPGQLAHMPIHDRFDLRYWIAQFPLEGLRAQAREFVLRRRDQMPREYPGEADVDRHIQLMEPAGEALIQVARGGVERAAEGLRIGVEAVAETLGHEVANVDDVHPRTGHELEVELDRR